MGRTLKDTTSTESLPVRTARFRRLIAFLCGLIFAAGLAMAGMTQPHKVIGFLDVFGDWDPALLFVMIGAILVHAISFQIIRRRPSPLFDSEFHLPKETKIDGRLAVGSILFGIGWGLGGYCPGPALVSIPTLGPRVAVFVTAMLAGMVIFKVAHVRRS